MAEREKPLALCYQRELAVEEGVGSFANISVCECGADFAYIVLPVLMSGYVAAVKGFR